MNNSIDQEFIEFVVKSLVGKPEAVVVERRIDEKGVLLELTVDPEDLGRVIGKRGATAQSLRTLLRALGTKNDARYNLKIVDNGVGGHTDDDDNTGSDTHGMSGTNGSQPGRIGDTAVVGGATGMAATTVASEPSQDNASSVTNPQHDDLDEVDTSKSAYDVTESDVVRKTRRELAEFDDLDV